MEKNRSGTMDVTDRLIEFAQHSPNKPALYGVSAVTGSVVRTYGELLHTAQQYALELLASRETEATSKFSNLQKLPDQSSAAMLQGMQRVGVLFPNRVEGVEIFVGVAIARAVAFVLDPKWTPRQLQAVLDQASLHQLYVDASLSNRLTDLSITADIKVVGQGTGSLPSFPPACSPGWKKRSATNDLPFYVGFTSGTTGVPKGVIRTHRAWMESFAASQAEFGTTATDSILVPGALTHSLSLYAAMECLNAGATLHLMPQFSPRLVIQQLERYPITMIVAVPTVLGAIAKTALVKHKQFSGLRAVVAGGSKLEVPLRAQLPVVFPGADVLEYLGASELGFISLASSGEAVPLGSVGRPFRGVSVSIRNLEGGGEASPGTIGWIGVKSSMMSMGYVQATDTAGLRLEEDWATVGDLGWQDDQGFLYVVGREQDMVVSNGVNIYPTEVEMVLRQVPGIEDVVVFGILDCDRQESLGAAIRWVTAPLSRAALQQYCRANLPPYQCPRQFFTVDQFPTTESGKISRVALREQAANHRLSLL